MFQNYIMRKSLSIIVFLLVTISTTIAQETREAQTVFNNNSILKKSDLGFFIAPLVGFTKMDQSSTTLLNVRGGINLKDKFSFGVFYSTSLNEIRPKSEVIPNIYMDYRSFGGFIEYTILAKKAIHLSFPLYVGYGEVEMDNEQGSARLGEANFFKIEPSALIEVNLLRNIRFNAGAGYRLVSNVQYRNLNQTDLSGLTGYIGFKLGIFK